MLVIQPLPLVLAVLTFVCLRNCTFRCIPVLDCPFTFPYYAHSRSRSSHTRSFYATLLSFSQFPHSYVSCDCACRCIPVLACPFTFPCYARPRSRSSHTRPFYTLPLHLGPRPPLYLPVLHPLSFPHSSVLCDCTFRCIVCPFTFPVPLVLVVPTLVYHILTFTLLYLLSLI